MFIKTINGLTLINGVADGVFGNITGHEYCSDMSFVATLRALLHKRVTKEESVKLEVSTSSYGYETVRGASAEAVVRAMFEGCTIRRRYKDDNKYFISVHHLRKGMTERDIVANFEAFGNGLRKVFDIKFEELHDIEAFLSQKGIRSKFYMSEDSKKIFILIDFLDMKRWHLLQSFVPRYFPKLFEAKPMEEIELKLVKSLTNRYAPAYEEIIEEIASQFDFRSQHIRNMLTGYETQFDKRLLKDVEGKIQRIREAICSLETQFAEYYRQIDKYLVEEAGLREKIANGPADGEESEMLQYFLCNKNIELTDVYEGEIRFIVKTVLSSFDPDVYDSSINNKRSFFYLDYWNGNRYRDDVSDEDIRLLMSAIFGEEILKIRVCAAYSLNFATGEYRGHKNYRFDAPVLATHTPNQHIQYYACLGNNQTHIRRALMDKDYVSAVSLCCSSASNFNMTEGNTGTLFMREIMNPRVGKIIQMPNGECLTPIDAINWLKERDAEKKKEDKTDE